MTTAVTTTPQRRFQDLIRSEKYRSGLVAALPKGVTADRIEKIVVSAMNKNPDLLQCTELSLYNACIDCATLDLWPGPQGHVYLIQRNNKVKEDGRVVRHELQATAMIGWRGMVELAYRSGTIVPGSFIGQAIHANDHIEYEYGSNQKIIHRPKLGDRGKPIAVWVGCVPKGGALVFHVMDTIEIETVRARSQSPNAGPWVTDWVEMACKTALRRLWKYLPSSVADKFAEALERDAEREFDLKQVHGTVIGSSRFSEDKSPGKEALDAATQEAERREAEVVTVEQCIALARTMDETAVLALLDSFQLNVMGDATPEQIPSLMSALTALKGANP